MYHIMDRTGSLTTSYSAVIPSSQWDQWFYVYASGLFERKLLSESAEFTSESNHRLSVNEKHRCVNVNIWMWTEVTTHETTLQLS